jgi:hypothetical protein
MDKVRELAGLAWSNLTLVIMITVTLAGLGVVIGLTSAIGPASPMLMVYIFIGALGVTGLASLVTLLPTGTVDQDFGKNSEQLVYVVLWTAAGIMALSVVACALCQQPRPRESFVDGSDALTPLREGVADAEIAVCKYITRADKYIAGDVGPAGKKNPSLVTAAEQKAREGVDLVLCSDGAPAEVDSSGDLADLDARLARLESTLAGFTGVVFKHSYDETVPCKEGFAAMPSVPTVADLTKRLEAVQATIKDQQTQYLDPMDQKTKDLQAGKASECDKKSGAKLAASGGGPKARSA